MNKETASRDQSPVNILVALKQAQAKYGYLPSDFLEELADSFELTENDIYGVASFYSFLATRPRGRNVIRICRSLPCYLQNSRMIVEAVEKELGITPGQTTPDGRFSFELTNCIGLCDRPPAMLVNHDPHVDLTPEKISRILQDYK